jgi:outer membrane protein OmpA-like peptidoglycan-associated protein
MIMKNVLLAALIVAASSALVACSSEPLLRPSATLSANPANVRKGNSTTLYWHASNADNVTITPEIGSVDTLGTRLVTVNYPVTYSLYAKGKGGDTTITFSVSTLPQPPSVSLLSTPAFIKRGEFSKLSWTSQDASDLLISPTVGKVSGATGEVVVSPNQTTAYTITAQNTDGTTTASTTVSIVPSKSRVIARIFFQTDKAAIVPTRSALRDNPNMANNKVVLDSLVEALKSRTDITISITGNTDPRGGDKVNEPLSKARALVIEKYLISRGIDKSRLNVKWVSDKNPLGHSDSDQDEYLDRRTGVRIETQSFGSLGN